MKPETQTINMLENLFKILERRILTHRRSCKGWNKFKPCFDCHYNTLTPIMRTIDELRE